MTKRERIANLKHVILHLEANKIDADKSGWYCGDRMKFIERHKLAKDMVYKMLAKEGKE